MVGGEFFEVCRPPYASVTSRWEWAASDMIPEDVHHAYGSRQRTLCGIEEPDMSASPWPWSGSRPQDCPECLAMAHVIDARWPLDRRGLNYRQSIPAAPAPPSTTPPAADELGRPDIRLPAPPTGGSRVLRKARPDLPADDVPPHDRRRPASPFRAAWCGAGLEPYRPRSSAFEGIPIDSLPPLDEASFVGDYGWFGDAGHELDYRTAVVDPIAAALAEAGLSLPDDFVALITRSNLHRALDRVSCRGCWTEVAGPLPSPAEPDARMVLFFRDQAVYWYLYLRPTGESFVVYSARDFTGEPELRYRADGTVATPDNEIIWCAPSVESFAYRYWVENRLWFAIHAKACVSELPPELLVYLAHYVPAHDFGNAS